MSGMAMLRPLLSLLPVLLLGGCDQGMSACERMTRAALGPDRAYQKIAAWEEPGETPAMTYYVIDYFVTLPGKGRLREQVHCSYMRDTGEAVPHLLSSVPTHQ